ncbi:hypothetical protein JZ751_024439 [Albula glossodonta]|uniref:Uncharacterized protein n=1 Tax=Albula glossodonta TaxID=121402 RepID=A0A8T2N1I8_9TELE|nr:hypothetical protein JZ751_024439 [Albula glossodonta]
MFLFRGHKSDQTRAGGGAGRAHRPKGASRALFFGLVGAVYEVNTKLVLSGQQRTLPAQTDLGACLACAAGLWVHASLRRLWPSGKGLILGLCLDSLNNWTLEGVQTVPNRFLLVKGGRPAESPPCWDRPCVSRGPSEGCGAWGMGQGRRRGRGQGVWGALALPQMLGCLLKSHIPGSGGETGPASGGGGVQQGGTHVLSQERELAYCSFNSISPSLSRSRDQQHQAGTRSRSRILIQQPPNQGTAGGSQKLTFPQPKTSLSLSTGRLTWLLGSKQTWSPGSSERTRSSATRRSIKVLAQGQDSLLATQRTRRGGARLRRGEERAGARLVCSLRICSPVGLK